MTELKCEEFLDYMNTRFWQNWQRSDGEFLMWKATLKRLDWDDCMAAVDAYVRQKGCAGSPKLQFFCHYVNAYGKAKPQTTKLTDSQTYKWAGYEWYIECVGNDVEPALLGWRVRVWMDRSDLVEGDEDRCMNIALKAAEKHRDVYKGTWIVFKKKLWQDDGLRGKAAREKAHKQILEGPPTKERLWLASQMEHEKMKEAKPMAEAVEQFKREYKLDD